MLRIIQGCFDIGAFFQQAGPHIPDFGGMMPLELPESRLFGQIRAGGDEVHHRFRFA